MRIAMILAISLFGVLVISAVALAAEAYASGGLMSLDDHKHLVMNSKRWVVRYLMLIILF